MKTRRTFLKKCAAGLTTLALPWPLGCAVDRSAVRSARNSKHFTIKDIRRTTVKIPYREVPRRAMDRELPHWRYSEITEVTLASGVVGFGETMLYYTWGETTDERVSAAMGKNAVDLMWDDKNGAGLQIALFDAVGKTIGVPVHRLLGHKQYDRTPLSWWNIDMPPEDMATECKEALASGYMSYKTKGRPWFDLWEQVDVAAKAVPREFKIDMDFNDTLRDAERAIPILKELEKYPQIDIYETPIPQGDVAGNRAIREATRVNIALHYGSPRPAVVVHDEVCDGFVVGGGATAVARQGKFSGEVEMPFWLQLVGSSITAAFSLHFGGVLRQAKWPAVNCHQLYQYSMLTQPIVVTDGSAAVPDKPGLGYDLDRDAVEKLRVDKPTERPDYPRLLETTWPDGRKMYTASHNLVNFILRQANRENMPFFERGVMTQQVPNDGSARWRELYEGAKDKPVMLQ